MKNKFDFYDIVKIYSDREELHQINGSIGVVMGMAQNEDTGHWGYSVSVPSDDDLSWHAMEFELLATGKKANPNDYKTGEIARVSVDPETGEGSIVEDED